MITESAVNRMLVEGRDDKHSVIHLMRRHSIDWESGHEHLPWIQECGGFDLLVDSVTVSAKSYPRLGILVDANTNVRQKWEQIRGKLQSVKVSAPACPESAGTILQGIYSDWRVGVWIMPDNQQAGKLEDFLKGLVPPNDACWGHANSATRQAKKIGAKFAAKNSLKATIHAWLAWQENPGLPFGSAITAAYFRHDSPEALKFAAWFRKLFLAQ